jgi:transposase
MYRQQGKSLLIPTPGKNIRVAVCGALRWPEGPFLFTHGRKSVNSRLFVDMLQKLQRRVHRTGKRIVLVLDNGPEHTSRLSLCALERLKSAIRVFWLPTYSSEQLNDIEAIWKHLKEDYFSRMLVTDKNAFPDTVVRLLSILQQPSSLRKILKPRTRMSVFQNLLRVA